MILVEEVDAGVRGWTVGLLGALSSVGYGLAAGVFALVNVMPYGWRGLYALALIPLVIIIPLRRSLPESHRYEEKRAARNIPRSAGAGDGAVSRVSGAARAFDVGRVPGQHGRQRGGDVLPQVPAGSARLLAGQRIDAVHHRRRGWNWAHSSRPVERSNRAADDGFDLFFVAPLLTIWILQFLGRVDYSGMDSRAVFRYRVRHDRLRLQRGAVPDLASLDRGQRAERRGNYRRRNRAIARRGAVCIFPFALDRDQLSDDLLDDGAVHHVLWLSGNRGQELEEISPEKATAAHATAE